MHHEPSELKVNTKTNDRLGNLAIQLKGTGSVVVLVSWLAAVVLVSIFGRDDPKAFTYCLLLGFIVMYLAVLSHSPQKPPSNYEAKRNP